jgi:hypothetical protein
MQPQAPSKPKKKIVCAGCKRKLTGVFSVCRCRQMFCFACIDPAAHACRNLSDFTALRPAQQAAEAG